MTTESHAPAASEPTTPVGTQLLTLDPNTYVTAVFASFRDQFEAAKTAAALITSVDVSTPAGMKVAVQHRAAFRLIRVEAEKARKLRKAPILEIGRLLDTRYKDLEAEIAPLEDRFDAAIKAEEQRKERERIAREQAEAERIARIQEGIRDIRGALIDVAGRSAEAIEEKILELVALEITKESCQEFVGEAEAAREGTLAKLREMHAAAVAQEAEAVRIAEERAELERRQAEQAERERAQREAAEAETRRLAEAEAERLRKIEAEDRARRERIEQEEREARERREAADREARERREADERRLKAEQDRIDAERRALEDKQREERLAEEARQREQRLAQEAAEREERERAEAEQRSRDEEARVAREAEEAREREAQRKANELLDGRELLVTFKGRFAHREEFAPVMKAIDAYLGGNKKPARQKAAAAA